MKGLSILIRIKNKLIFLQVLMKQKVNSHDQPTLPLKVFNEATVPINDNTCKTMNSTRLESFIYNITLFYSNINFCQQVWLCFIFLFAKAETAKLLSKAVVNIYLSHACYSHTCKTRCNCEIPCFCIW